MDHQIIKQIVEAVFKKAKKETPSHTKNALSHHIANKFDGKINYRTFERAYEKYIEGKNIGAPKKGSIKFFCKYLGYEDYEDYITKNEQTPTPLTKPSVKKQPKKNPIDRKRLKRLLFIIIIILILFIGSYNVIVQFIYQNNINTNDSNTGCMAWAKDHYELVDCDNLFHKKYNTKVIPYNASLYKNMKKIRVNAAYTFFSEIDQKPLVWYYKTKKGTIEYFTAPGFHPVNGETLKKITPGIITKYVPIHNLQPDSFLSNDSSTETMKKHAVLILNNGQFDDAMTTAFNTRFFNPKSEIIRLKDSKKYDETFITSFHPEKDILSNNQNVQIDTLILGTTEYIFKKNNTPPNTTTCTVTFNYTVYSKNQHKWYEIVSKRKQAIGIGYSETEAKHNAINKTNHE